MSNIDFSRVVSSADRVRHSLSGHADGVKAECKRRILAHISLEAQQNITRAIAMHAACVTLGDTAPETAKNGGLSKADLERALDAQQWIAAMQEACRAACADTTVNLADDDIWPRLPEGVSTFVSRF
ncbi:MAG: hypothetical protein AAFS01_00040 [Pseudomonadota bacterium]